MSLESDKKTFKEYGDIIEYADLKNDHFPQQSKQGHRLHPGYLVKKSDFSFYVTSVIAACSTIEVPDRFKIPYSTSEIDFIEKRKNYLKINECVEDHHYLPYNIPKNDILFFTQIKREQISPIIKNLLKPYINEQSYLFIKKRPYPYIDKQPYPFIIVEDDFIDRMLQAEHTIFGIIDFSQGESLLYQDSNVTKSKMEIFHKEIERVGEKYKKILFITISDSILLKYSFKTLSDGNLKLQNFDFKMFIEAFNDIKIIIKKIFHMSCYGIFSYGSNLSKTLTSNNNVLHTGILSNEFKHIIDLDSKVKKIRKDKQGDIYLTKALYRTYRHTVVKEYKKNGEIKEFFNTDYGISSEDIIDKKDSISVEDITTIKLADPPFKVSKFES